MFSFSLVLCGMASQVLSGCGIRRPLPQKSFANSGHGLISSRFINPQKNRNLDVPRKNKFDRVKFPLISYTPIVFPKRVREWAAPPKMCAESEKVSFSCQPLRLGGEGEGEEEKGGRRIEVEFDPAVPPPFTLGDIKASIPKHCWVKDPWRSMSYVIRDVVAIFGLAAVAAYLNSRFVWPLYWVLQGTLFWALFVLGHDCGHGSFSNNPKLNSVAGHILHSSILVPYHGWRISHRTHHQNHGHVEKDESWHPLSESLYRNLDKLTRTLRFTLPFPMLAYPFYLWTRSPGKKGSHFNPSSELFVPSERNSVITSTVCWTVMVTLLLGLSFLMGPISLLKLYGVPYWVFVTWLDSVTYLHHHGHERKLPWYRGKEWSYLRGGLTTIDRDYGLFNNIHHDIGTHVIHHLFPQIPHYHLVEATEAAKHILGKYYREPRKSGALPVHLWGTLIESLEQDHFVSDIGDVVFYQTDDPDIAEPKESSP